ncbi:hypothetical protein BJ508DRAFT_379982 [Ascobolus immersus RN42]|uniref:Uncharacterized protein n=1 Tax=Ascobolus immersus RN42 TaxID=1160509 RepID=A0A3N4HRG9_ASCIM|nr:hypothetical protein BJ508DRAFT_379982 [Ascobolus immersus RN42]
MANGPFILWHQLFPQDIILDKSSNIAAITSWATSASTVPEWKCLDIPDFLKPYGASWHTHTEETYNYILANFLECSTEARSDGTDFSELHAKWSASEEKRQWLVILQDIDFAISMFSNDGTSPAECMRLDSKERPHWPAAYTCFAEWLKNLEESCATVQNGRVLEISKSLRSRVAVKLLDHYSKDPPNARSAALKFDFEKGSEGSVAMSISPSPTNSAPMSISPSPVALSPTHSAAMSISPPLLSPTDSAPMDFGTPSPQDRSPAPQ